MQQSAISTSEKQARLGGQVKASMGLLDRMIPLGKAANLLGVDTRTLRRWLEGERGLAFPRLGRGASLLVKITDIQAVIARHQGTRKYTPDENHIVAPQPEPLMDLTEDPIVAPSTGMGTIP
jgi:hypothetical protein